MKYEKSCGCVILNEDKILLIKQRRGSYGFPKGHTEKQETELETAIREVKEETGLDVEVDLTKRYSITYPKGENVLKEVVYFLAKTDSYDVKIQEIEIEEAKWVPINEINNIIVFEDLKNMWNIILKENF